MPEPEDKSLEELQKLKLQSEIDKNTAEVVESKKRTKSRWANYIIAGVIGAAAIYSWVHSTFSDLAKERNELASIRRERLQIRSDSLLAVSTELAKQKADLDNQVIAITARLDSTIGHQEKELRLVTARLKKKEKSKDRGNGTEIKRLTAQISKLNEDIKNIKNEKEQIRTIVPAAYLSLNDVRGILKEKDYFDSRLNPDALGAENKFEPQQEGRVVFDGSTGLTWQRSGSFERKHVGNTQAYIRLLNQEKYTGYPDWRLPTLEEAMSLVEPKENQQGLYIDAIFDKNQAGIWTSDKKSDLVAWGVDFSDGYCYRFTFHLTYYVRAVR